MPHPTLTSAARKLRSFDPARFKVLVGLDGFVDNIIDVVDQRTGAESYSRVETIAALAERIGRAAGLSSNLELVVRKQKLGGNGPIMANALIQAGFGVTYLGNVGRPALHPVFEDMAKRCRAVYSLAEPGHTDALEFRDGKLMLGKHQTLKDVTYERILEVVGPDRLRAAWTDSHLIALTNWTMLPYQTDIWRRLQADMKGHAPPKDAVLFVDLADPEKRPPEEIAEAARFLGTFRPGHRVVLGMNQKESLEVSRALGLDLPAEAIEANAMTLRQILELDAVVIHPTRNAAAVTAAGSAYLDGPYCLNPVLTTGAGDNFNAGFCIGLLAGLSPQEMLAAGTANSGFYVRNGRSATGPDLAAFLELWDARYGDPGF